MTARCELQKAFLIKDDEIQEFILFSYINRRRIIKDRENLIEMFDDYSFRQTFHLSKGTIFIYLFIYLLLQETEQQNAPSTRLLALYYI